MNRYSAPACSGVPARPSSSTMAGNRANAVTNVTASPMLIIHPKSMTGLMPLNTSDPNPMMVVSAV